MRRLLIKKESFWDRVCDCCEPTEMPYYVMYLDGELVNTYTPLEREVALEAFLETLGYEVQYEDEED